MSLHCVKCGMSEFHETDNYHDFCECIIPSYASICKVCRCDLVWHWEFCPRCGNQVNWSQGHFSIIHDRDKRNTYSKKSREVT